MPFDSLQTYYAWQERTQAYARFALCLLAALWLAAVRVPIWVVGLVLAYGLYALATLAWIRRDARHGPARRLLHAVADPAVISVVMAAAGAPAVALFGLYLWVMIGHGLRFGMRHLVLSGVTSVIGFIAGGLVSGFAAEHRDLFFGLLGSLVILPLFYWRLVGVLHTALQAYVRRSRDAEELARRLRTEATTDALTGVLNRRGLVQAFERCLDWARAAGDGGRRVAIVVADVDGLKAVNDRYGHAAGDQLIRTVALRLETQLRAGDVIARIGGDEFVLCLRVEPGVDAADLCERLRQRIMLAGPVLAGEASVPVRISVGMALWPEESTSLEGLLAIADQRMYDQKHRRKRRLAAG